jgi:Zn-finger nucleic acid-binding protein
MDLCNICKAIKFDQLPSEEKPVIPHQPDLESLQESMPDCPICRVIFLAVGELSTIIHNERTGNGENAGGHADFQTPIGKQPGHSVIQDLTYVAYYGYYNGDPIGIIIKLVEKLGGVSIVLSQHQK